MLRRPPRSTRTDTLFPYTTLFRSRRMRVHFQAPSGKSLLRNCCSSMPIFPGTTRFGCCGAARTVYLSPRSNRSEEHTCEHQSLMRISYTLFSLTDKLSIIKKKYCHHVRQQITTETMRNKLH